MFPGYTYDLECQGKTLLTLVRFQKVIWAERYGKCVILEKVLDRLEKGFQMVSNLSIELIFTITNMCNYTN